MANSKDSSHPDPQTPLQTNKPASQSSTPPLTSENPKLRNASTRTYVSGDTNHSSSSVSRKTLVKPIASSQLQPLQESNLNNGKESGITTPSDIEDEQWQPEPKCHDSPQKDDDLFKKVDLHEQKLKALGARLDKIDKKLNTTQKTNENFLFDILEKAKNPEVWLSLRSPFNFFHRQQANTVTQESDKKAETRGNQPTERPVVVTAGDTEPEAIVELAVSGRMPTNSRPGSSSEAEAEKLRLQTLVADLTARQEALKSENALLNVAVSSLKELRSNYDDLDLNHEILRASYDELETTVRTHRCPNGDELELSDRQLHDDFEDLAARIEELIDHCYTLSIDNAAIMNISQVCLANDLPSWWNSKVTERAKKLWLRGLVANVLSAKFFKRRFYGLDGHEQLELGLVGFENLIFAENSGVDERLALQWRARTFRLINELRNKDNQSLNPKSLEAYEALRLILEPHFAASKEDPFDHIKSLKNICELALQCASLLRCSTSSYTWDQQSAPKKIKGPTVRHEGIRLTNKETLRPFNVFGELLRLRPKGAPVQILKPTVGVFLS